jgi:hypothetical protein
VRTSTPGLRQVKLLTTASMVAWNGRKHAGEVHLAAQLQEIRATADALVEVNVDHIGTLLHCNPGLGARRVLAFLAAPREGHLYGVVVQHWTHTPVRLVIVCKL